jgi:hypothetical protein
MGEKREFLWGSLRGRDHLGGTGVEDRIILNGSLGSEI